MDDLKRQLQDISFDIEQPPKGHFNRFQKKLEKQEHSPKQRKLILARNTYKYAGIAAVFVLVYLFLAQLAQPISSMELAEVSPKMEKAQRYFSFSIEKEWSKLNKAQVPEAQKIIRARKKELDRLKQEYQKMTIDLWQNNKNKRVVAAMIFNFQKRLEVLKDLNNEIEHLKQFKKQWS